MSEGIWDGIDVTVCPHGYFLNTGDPGPCGCQIKILTKDDVLIDAGPYETHIMERKVDNDFFRGMKNSYAFCQNFAYPDSVLTLRRLVTTSRTEVRQTRDVGVLFMRELDKRLEKLGLRLGVFVGRGSVQQSKEKL